MTETEIQQALVTYLRLEGYQTWYPSRGIRGPDVVGYHPDRHHLWIIEAKGNIKDTGSRQDAFRIALGQICERGAEEWKKKINNGVFLPADSVTYGVAFPEGEDYRSLCRKIRSGVRSALSLYLFFIRLDHPTPTIIGPHVENL